MTSALGQGSECGYWLRRTTRTNPSHQSSITGFWMFTMARCLELSSSGPWGHQELSACLWLQGPARQLKLEVHHCPPRAKFLALTPCLCVNSSVWLQSCKITLCMLQYFTSRSLIFSVNSNFAKQFQGTKLRFARIGVTLHARSTMQPRCCKFMTVLFPLSWQAEPISRDDSRGLNV